MAKFTDSITIRVKAGNGGPGSVSFRREKYVPKGGPDGGDGGKGGNVYIEADRRYYNLSHFFKDRIYNAKNGTHGMGRNRHGKDGEDIVIKVPPGTQVIDFDSGDLIVDLIQEEEKFLIDEGGIGGKGNEFFKSSIQQTPRFAQPGEECEEMRITLNLKLIADIGLVGLPNAGKSTLLSKITNARPKIGDYPFTTLIPNLGMINLKNDKIYSIADIPGIIEGAHKGHGLGLSFLQHIERVKVILYLIDISEEDPVYTYSLLKSELQTYNDKLLSKPTIILFTKSDLMLDEEIEEKIKLFKESKDIVVISAIEGSNLEILTGKIEDIMKEYEVIEEQNRSDLGGDSSSGEDDFDNWD